MQERRRSDTVTIAPLVTADEIDDVMAVERACFTNPWTEEMHRAELANPDRSHFLLARAGDQVVGACTYWRVLDEIHINNIAVVPAFRRAGIGSALLARVLQEGRAGGAARVLLEVRRSNEAARRLYGRAGFVLTQIRRRYYSDPDEDALVLTCDLSSADV
jgi:ribosomal-protein-alanine N-acetyltransferase